MKKHNENDTGTDYIDSIISYMQKNRMQTFYNLVLFLVILIQAPFMIAGLDSVTVEVDLPPKGKVIVTNNAGNELYYSLWAEHFTNDKVYFSVNDKGEKQEFPFTYSLVDFDYTNVEQKYSEFLKKYKPSKLLKDRRIYQSFIKNVKVKMISQSFEVERINTEVFKEGQEAQATVYGVAHQKASSTVLADKECKYTMTFERIGGKLYVTSLSTDCF